MTTDAMKNVVISVPASPGWETRPGVVLQAHMDMVCVQTETSTHDFTQDSIFVIREGDWVHAKDTTLGATVLKGQRMISLDSEDARVVTPGAAGGIHTDVSLPLPMMPLTPDQQAFVLKVSGLIGGHSGVDIDRNRANANVLVVQLLTGTVPFQLVGMNGGAVDNAITTSSQATLAVVSGDVAALQKRVTDFAASAKAPYPDETGMTITLTAMTNTLQLAASAGDSAKALALIDAIPQGVTAWSTEFAGLPETSNNIGIVTANGSQIDIATFQRSFHADNLHAIADQIAATARSAGATSSQRGEFSAWPPNSRSALYKAMNDAYSRLVGSTLATSVIHAGLECGYFAEKYPAMEIVSIGPTLENVHTTNERLEVASLRRLWNLVQDVLQAP